MATEHELTITRVFDAPRELVFAAWTDPDHLAKWWGPAGFTATSCTVALADGGRWRVCISDGAGTDIWASGAYREIVRPERLVFTFAWDEPDGSRGLDTVVTVTLADRDGKTEMTFHQAAFPTVVVRDNHESGWAETFADLVDHLKETVR
jgi:uncharacterized protein YndB with AHSA1/START domain